MLDPESLTLVAITDGARSTDDIVQRALACVRGGATMVQLRLKDADARTQVEVARALVAALPAHVPLIMNDRADLAIAAGAAGVHVGPEDLPSAAVRRIVGPDRIVGVSVGNDAEALQASDADYVGIGPVYATASKDDAGIAIGTVELERLITLCARPAVGIGGVDASNAAAVVAAGARGIAVIRALFSASDPEAAARSLRSAIGR
ncbi:MAG TPA: thiamine phosphate synthase [Gemmatimonadaceae bacterium]|jgi:thiamine-phosphate pyrophosphorylase|nr:thiamine phosphate synthase [Gemmatimonadaceae bacterium]